MKVYNVLGAQAEQIDMAEPYIAGILPGLPGPAIASGGGWDYALLWQLAIWLLPVLVFLALLLLFQMRYWELKRRYDDLMRDSLGERERLHGAENLLQCMSRLGRMRYFIVAPDDTAVLMEGGADGVWMGSFKAPEEYMLNMAPSDREHFLANWRKLLNGEQDAFYESYRLYYNGAPCRYMEYVESYCNVETGRRLVLVAGVDVSALEKQNFELADADMMLKAIFENLPGLIFTKDVNSDFVYSRCNAAFSGILGKEPDEIYGKSDFELFGATDHALRIRSSDLEIVRDDTRIDYKWFVTDHAGRPRVIRLLKRLMTRADGSRYILGFGVDISRQESAERNLRRRNKEYRMLLDHVAAGVLLLDSEFRIVHANSRAMRLLDLTPENLRTVRCFEVGCRFAQPPESCAAQQAFADGERHYQSLGGMFHGRELIMAAQPVFDENGKITHVVVTYYDVTGYPGGALALLSEFNLQPGMRFD